VLAFLAFGGINDRDRARAGVLIAWLRQRFRAPAVASP
jgi:hypothetical protein